MITRIDESFYKEVEVPEEEYGADYRRDFDSYKHEFIFEFNIYGGGNYTNLADADEDTDEWIAQVAKDVDAICKRILGEHLAHIEVRNVLTGEIICTYKEGYVDDLCKSALTNFGTKAVAIHIGCDIYRKLSIQSFLEFTENIYNHLRRIAVILYNTTFGAEFHVTIDDVKRYDYEDISKMPNKFMKVVGKDIIKEYKPTEKKLASTKKESTSSEDESASTEQEVLGLQYKPFSGKVETEVFDKIGKGDILFYDCIENKYVLEALTNDCMPNYIVGICVYKEYGYMTLMATKCLNVLHYEYGSNDFTSEYSMIPFGFYETVVNDNAEKYKNLSPHGPRQTEMMYTLMNNEPKLGRIRTAIKSHIVPLNKISAFSPITWMCYNFHTMGTEKGNWYIPTCDYLENIFRNKDESVSSRVISKNNNFAKWIFEYLYSIGLLAKKVVGNIDIKLWTSNYVDYNENPDKYKTEASAYNTEIRLCTSEEKSSRHQAIPFIDIYRQSQGTALQ